MSYLHVLFTGVASCVSFDTSLPGFLELWSGRRDVTSAAGDAERGAGNVNTPFRKDGPALRVPIGTSGVVFGLPNCCVGRRTACNSQCVDEDGRITGDERHRMYSYAIFTFCVVCCDASNS